MLDFPGLGECGQGFGSDRRQGILVENRFSQCDNEIFKTPILSVTEVGYMLRSEDASKYDVKLFFDTDSQTLKQRITEKGGEALLS